MAQGYRTARDLVVLERDGEHILFNPELVDPVYLSEGGFEALEVFEALKKLTAPFSEKSGKCPPDLFDFFCEHNLIVPDDFSLSNLQTGLSDIGPDRLSLFLLLAQSCNQACCYCFNGRSSYSIDQPMMTEETAFLAIDGMLDFLSPEGILSIVFFGGEPLLNWPLAKKIMEYSTGPALKNHPNKSVRFDLTTNLTIFPEDLAARCLEYDVSVLVDVDGPEDIHNITRPFKKGGPSLEVTVRNIERLNNFGVPVHLRATITSYNQHRMKEVAKFHKDIGGASCALLPLNPVDSDGLLLPRELYPDVAQYADGLRQVFDAQIWPVENIFPFDEFVARLKPGTRVSQGCTAHQGTRPAVTAGGKIFSCLYLVNNEKYEVGDVKLNDFPRSPALKRMEKTVHMDNRPDCPECEYRLLCGGGCPLGLLAVAENPNVPEDVIEYTQEINCAMTKASISAILWDMCQGVDPQDIVSD